MRLYELFDLETETNDEDPDYNHLIPKIIKYDPEAWDLAGDKILYDSYCSRKQIAKINDLIKQLPEQTMEVPHNRMVTGQKYVSGEGLLKYQDGNRESASGKLPSIRLSHGWFVILDGNHRIVSDIIAGKTSTKCMVKDVTEFVKLNDDDEWDFECELGD